MTWGRRGWVGIGEEIHVEELVDGGGVRVGHRGCVVLGWGDRRYAQRVVVDEGNKSFDSFLRISRSGCSMGSFESTGAVVRGHDRGRWTRRESSSKRRRAQCASWGPHSRVVGYAQESGSVRGRWSSSSRTGNWLEYWELPQSVRGH